MSPACITTRSARRNRLSIPSQDPIWVKRLALPLAQDGDKVDLLLAIWLADRRSIADFARNDPAGEASTPMVLEWSRP